MTYSKRPQVGFELEFGPPVHRVAPHEQAVSCSFFYLCLLCFLMFLLACLFFAVFCILLFKPCFDWCNRKRGSILKRSLKYKHLIEVIAAHLSKGTRAESKLSSAIRSEVCFVQKCCVGLISLWRNVFVSQTPKTLTKEYVASWNLLVNISKRQDCALHMNAEHFGDDS